MEQQEENPEQTHSAVEVDIMELAIESRRIMANDIVKNHIIASITLGMVPVPLFDLAALTTTQMNMLRSLSEHYAIPAEGSNMTSLVTSLISGSLPVLGVIGLSSFAKIIPGIGSLAGSAGLGVTAGAVTYAVGQTFIMHFEEGGTFEDFDHKKAQAFFKREIESGKTFVKEMRDELKNKDAEAEVAATVETELKEADSKLAEAK